MTRISAALVFEDPSSRALLHRIEKLAPADVTVLITGETGTGKEIVARHLHEGSARARGPFVAVNCGALSPALFDGELFGHEKGAFTGAFGRSQGWFEAADGGTLFLDEIGDLPLPAQVKLLRVLQEREVVRVGARRPVAIDVRILAATNANLARAVAEKRFREDLYYRLRVAPVALVPLRDRPGDIVPLARHFLTRYAASLGLRRAEIAPDAIEALLAHPWPGNIRELENAIHHALLVSPDGVVGRDGLQLAESHALPPRLEAPPASTLEAAVLSLLEENRPNLHEHIEATILRTVYEFSEKNQVHAARLLGISRNVVRARLLQHGLLASGGRAPRPAPAPEATAPAPVRVRAPRVLRIAHQKFGLLALVKALGRLDQAMATRDVRVEWIECATGMQVVGALASERADVGVMGEAPPVFAQASPAGAGVVYLAAEPPAPEGEAIVVHADAALHAVTDLRGKTLALSRGANVLYFVLRALEEAGLGLADVDLRYLPPGAARAAFEGREVDGWAIWNPLLASTQHDVQARVLRDARGLAPNRAFYVGRPGFAEALPDVVSAFLTEVGAAGRWANESPARAASALAPHVDIAQQALEASLARTRFGLSPLDGETLAAQQRIADTLHRFQLIARRVDVSRAVWSPPRGARCSG